MERQPIIGETVHFVLNTGPNAGTHRPAIVVSISNSYTVNLQVFSDGTKSIGDSLPNVFWKRGAILDEAGKSQGTWHFPEPQTT